MLLRGAVDQSVVEIANGTRVVSEQVVDEGHYGDDGCNADSNGHFFCIKMGPQRIIVCDLQVWFDCSPRSGVMYRISELVELLARSVVQFFIQSQVFHRRIASAEQECNPIPDFLLGSLPLRDMSMER